MSCVIDTTPITIIQGSDVIINVELFDSSACGDCKTPFDLTGFTSGTAEFLNADTTTLSVPVSVVSLVLGQLTVSLSDAQTALLNVGEAQPMEIQLTISGDITIVQFAERVTVVAQLL